MDKATHSLQIPFESINAFSSMDKAYVSKAKDLDSFYKYEPTLESFEKIFIDKKQSHPTDRKLLHAALTQQYQQLGIDRKSMIDSLLDDNTFTVTTAHQPSLMTGPLYTIIKIASTISLAKEVQAQYPAYNIIPVYWTGGEDHDFDEMNHCTIFSETITWHTSQKGAVGRFQLDESFHECIAKAQAILGRDTNLNRVLEAAEGSKTFNEWNSKVLNHLFADHQLLIVSGDDKLLKSSFKQVLTDELLHQISHPYINAATESLTTRGFKGQAYSRPINLFYLHQQTRSRIVKEENVWKVLDTAVVFAKADVEDEIKMYPDRFSPNVNLRPLYQEWILPNLAYVGGGGEIAYWLQQKELFDHYSVNYPMLVRRDSIGILDQKSLDKLASLHLSLNDLSLSPDALTKRVLELNSNHVLSLSEENQQINHTFEKIVKKFESLDITQAKSIAGQLNTIQKQIEGLESRLVRIEKQKMETQISQVLKIQDKLFPDQGLQERRENIFMYFSQYGKDIINLMVTVCNPLTTNFKIIVPFLSK